MADRINSYLGFCARAGRLLTGYNACMDKMKRIKLLIITEDTADNSVRKLVTKAGAAGSECRIFGDSEKLSRAAGVNGKKVFGITDSGLGGAIREEIDKYPVSGRCFNDDKDS